MQHWSDTNATLAFEDAQVIPHFSGEETNNTDDTDDTYDTYDTDDTGDTDYTDDKDDAYDIDNTVLVLFCYFSTTFPLVTRYFSANFR